MFFASLSKCKASELRALALAFLVQAERTTFTDTPMTVAGMKPQLMALMFRLCRLDCLMTTAKPTHKNRAGCFLGVYTGFHVRKQF